MSEEVREEVGHIVANFSGNCFFLSVGQCVEF